MSILIRKECQPALDAAGLEMLHVAVHDKTLTLDRECGRTLIAISGIRFHSNSPKVAEVEYATKLFHKFLEKHINALRDYTVLLQEFNSLPIPAKPESSSDRYPATILSYTHFRIDYTGTVTDINGRPTVADIVEEYEANLPDITKYFKELHIYKEIESRLHKAKDALSTCNI